MEGALCVLKWIEIRHQYRKEDVDVVGLRVDISHSSLLRRIIDGKQIFDVPPPRRFSYPWYELLEKGEGNPHEVWVPTEQAFGFPCVVIDQSIWKLAQPQTRGGEFIVRYMIGRESPPTWSDTEWVVCKDKEKWVIRRKYE